MTKEQLIETLKNEYPSLRIGSDQTGYTELNAEDYEATINSWADARIAKEEAKAKAQALHQTKIAAYEKMGLTGAEIEVLIPTPQPGKF